MPEQWEVWLIPCQKSITVPTTACQSLDELKEAVLNACLVAAPELVPVSWLDAGRLQQSMVLSTREDEAELTALRFKDLRTLTPALQADVVPAEEAGALAEQAAPAPLLKAEQAQQAIGEAAALEAPASAPAHPLPPPARSVPFLLKLTVPMYGIGIAWGAQYAKVTPVLQELGLPPWALSVAWLAGPISGIIVQPLVGQLSDRTRGSSRCFAGKRRLWMWVGNLGLDGSMLLMAFCPNIGLALGDTGNGTHPAALALAVLAFWLADFFLNALQGPARTLVVDAVPPEQQALANSLFSVWDSLGKISGFAFGALDVQALLPGLADGNVVPGRRALFADCRALFGFSILALLATQGVNQIGYVEPPPHPAARAERLGHPLRPLLSSLRLVPSMPRRVQGVLACLFFLFVTWFITWMYLPAFMGSEVFGGSPDAELADDDPAKLAYNAGTRAYSLGMTGASLVTLVCAPTLPVASRRWGEGRVLLALELLHAALLLSTALISHRGLAIAAIAGLGLPFAGFLVIPYSIVGRAAARTSGAAQYMATMNLFICLPELLVSLAVGPLVAALGDNMRAPMLIACGSCVVAVGLVYHLLVASPEEPQAAAEAAPAAGAADGAPVAGASKERAGLWTRRRNFAARRLQQAARAKHGLRRARAAAGEGAPVAGLRRARVRAKDEGDANLLANDSAREALELSDRARLPAPTDSSSDVWRAKADEPPVWVSPAGGQA